MSEIIGAFLETLERIKDSHGAIVALIAIFVIWVLYLFKREKSQLILAACVTIIGFVAMIAVVLTIQPEPSNQPEPSKNEHSPIATLKVTPRGGEAPLTVLADASQSADTDGDNLSFRWFIDGKELDKTESALRYTFTMEGEHTLVVRVDDSSHSAVAQQKLRVIPPSSPPIADFDISETYGELPLTVRFADKSQQGPAEWIWNFGDGESSKERNPIHTYRNPSFNYNPDGACFELNAFAVTLTVRNRAGENSKLSKNVITAKPKTLSVKLQPEPISLLGYVELQHNPGCSRACVRAGTPGGITLGGECLTENGKFGDVGYYFAKQEIGFQANHEVREKNHTWVFDRWSTGVQDSGQLSLPAGDHLGRLNISESITVFAHYKQK